MSHGNAFGMFGLPKTTKNREENTMTQVIRNLEAPEILRAFASGSKNEELRLLLPKRLSHG